MKILITAGATLGILLGCSQSAEAQQSDALRCLDSVKPIVRNEDGSLSPNPAFDACLRNPIIVQRAAKPVAIGARASASMPAAGSTPLTSAALLPRPSQQWAIAPNGSVEATIRSWLPAGWQLKWDTKEQPRATTALVANDFLDAVKALAGTRRQWTGADGARLQILVFKADRIVQVRDATAITEQTTAAGHAIRTEPLSGATP